MSCSLFIIHHTQQLTPTLRYALFVFDHSGNKVFNESLDESLEMIEDNHV
jgi:hypothetical protein